MDKRIKLIVVAVSLVVGLILFSIVNPFSWNDAGNRTVVERSGGDQFVQFTPGIFYAGFFAKEREWPNQISVTYKEKEANYNLEDNGIEIGTMKVMFSDGTTADVKGITQYILPQNEKDMIMIHNTHRTPQSLVEKRLAPYTKECLQSSAQLMTSEMHYGGGRAQMAQDFLQQLKDGVFLLSVKEKIITDSIDHEKKRIYATTIQTDKDGNPRRKISSIKEYEISVADAAIVDVDYEPSVDERRAKIIAANTKASVSKSDLITAQQQALTAKAEGEQKLVEIEYQQKQSQMKQVVEAQTKVMLAEEDKKQQKIAYEGSILEGMKIKTLADAEAYKKQRIMSADGALEMKLKYETEQKKAMWDAFAKYQGPSIVPTTIMGNTGNQNYNAMEMMMNLQMMNQFKK